MVSADLVDSTITGVDAISFAVSFTSSLGVTAGVDLTTISLVSFSLAFQTLRF